MSKNIEVELRGLLTADQAKDLTDFLLKNGHPKGEKHRVLVDYSTFLPGGVRDRKKDIRIRITNGEPELIIKLGGWGGEESREEVSVFTRDTTFDVLARAMSELGYKKGVCAERFSKVFDYKDVEFAIVEVPNHSYYFEVEKMVASNEEPEALSELRELCKSLELECLDAEGFYQYIEALNKEANLVFDADKAPKDFFRATFGV